MGPLGTNMGLLGINIESVEITMGPQIIKMGSVGINMGPRDDQYG